MENLVTELSITITDEIKGSLMVAIPCERKANKKKVRVRRWVR